MEKDGSSKGRGAMTSNINESGRMSEAEQLLKKKDDEDKSQRYAKAMEAILQYSPGGIFSYSAEEDEAFSYISDNMLAFLGYTYDEFIAKFDNRFSQMVYADDRQRVMDDIARQIAQGSFDRCEYRIEKKDGDLVWVHDEGHIVADAAGKRWFYVVIVDITETVNARKRERRKYHDALEALLAVNPEADGTIELNLTRNLCGEGHGMTKTSRRIISAETVDGYFASILDAVLDDAQRRALLPVLDRQVLIEGFERGMTERHFEYRRAGDDGAALWIRLYLNLLANPDTGDVEGVAYSVDISREKRRDAVLKIITSQENDLVALIHLDTQKVEAYFLGDTMPKAFRQLLPEPGATCDLAAYRAYALDNWVHPEDCEQYRRYSDPAYYRPLMDQDKAYEFILRECFPEAEGGVMYRKFQHYYLENDRNTILVIESDATRFYVRQQQELEKAKAEAQNVKDLMDYISSGIAILQMPDRDHLETTYVNDQMYRLLGFELDGGVVTQSGASAAEQLNNTYARDAFFGVHPGDQARVRKAFSDHFEDTAFSIDNYRILGAGNRYYWIKVEVRLRKVTAHERVFYATYHDVSEEVRLNAELKGQLVAEKQLRQEAMTANAAKTDFLSRMSHDMRTPLNGIIGMTYLAQMQTNPPETADCLAKIDTSSKFLLGLIGDVLDMSRAESDSFELNPEPYTLDELDRYIDALIRPLCSEKGQHFVLDEEMTNRELVPLADKLRTNQILFNLLSNAVKYTPEGGTITYRIAGKQTGPKRLAIEHAISDTGIGMSADFQKILFEPFSQEGRDDNSEKRGSGLGLAIVKKLVDLMGGSITVESRPGQGTTFHLRLEFDAIPADQVALEGDGTTASIKEGKSFEGRHVLLCEDHPLNQEITRTILEQRGAAVEIAGNGKAGIERFNVSPIGYYDLILMDIRMPVMDGYAATRKIRSLEREDASRVPIVAMTADAFSGDVRRCLEAGMNDHLSKPIDPELLFSTLYRFLEK
jgi:PAS domain S-box-containing protein